jgi:outer membrane protein assembly factor BamE (lipoprotein component of BamABCDE complex)
MDSKWYRFAAAVVLAAMVLGCTSTGQRAPRGEGSASSGSDAVLSTDEMVEVGMSKREVRGIWGEPRDIAPKEGESDTEVWTYEFRKALAGTQSGGSARAVVKRTIYTLTFEGNRLATIEENTF